jgi:riboflavin synthase
MFTGIVEEVGVVRSVQRRAGVQRTTVDAERVLEGLRVGDSINLSGVCHTAVAFDGSGFIVESVDETLRRSTLGQLRVGARLNLERALRLGDRLGGHLVAGHVDGVGRVIDRTDAPGNVLFRIGLSRDLAPYVAEKGSIAVDGISLTVVSAGELDFSVAIIPHTLAATTLADHRPGDSVNLEVDTVARYVERLLATGRIASGAELTEAGIREMGAWAEGIE